MGKRRLWRLGGSLLVALSVWIGSMSWGSMAVLAAEEGEAAGGLEPSASSISVMQEDASEPGVSGPERPEKKWEATLPMRARGMTNNWGIGSRNGGAYPFEPLFGADGTIYAGTTSVQAFRPDGGLKWEATVIKPEDMHGIFQAIRWVRAAPNGNLYVVTTIGWGPWKLTALSPNGNILWESYNHREYVTPPVFSSMSHMYMVNMDQELQELTSDGALLWTSGMQVKGTPVVGGDDSVYVLGVGGEVYRISPDKTIEHLATISGAADIKALGSDGTLYLTGDRVIALNPDGTVKWERGDIPSAWIKPTKSGTVYAGGGSVYALNENGSTEWQLNPEPFYYPTRYAFSDDLYYTSPSIGADGTLYLALNQYTVEDDSANYAWGVIGAYAHTLHGRILAVTPEGHVKWQYNHGYTNAGPSLGPDGSLYASSDSKFVAIGSGCTPFAQTADWTIRANSCYVNSDGTQTFTGNVRINSLLRLSTDEAIVDAAKGEIRSKGKLYMPLMQVSSKQDKAYLTKDSTILTDEGVKNNPESFHIGQKLMLAGIPFTIERLWWNEGELYADFDVEVMGQHLKAHEVKLLEKELTFHAGGEGGKLVSFKGFSLKELDLKYEPAVDKLTGEAVVGIPRLGRLEGLTGRLGFLRGELNQLGLGADFCKEGNIFLQCGIPIGSTTMRLTYLEGEVENLSSHATDPLTIRAVADINGGVLQLRGYPLVSFDNVTAELDTSWKFGLSGNMKVFDYPLSDASVTLDKEGLQAKAELEIDNTFIYLNGKVGFAVTPQPSLNGSGSLYAEIPEDSPIALLKKGPLGSAEAVLDKDKIVLKARPWAKPGDDGGIGSKAAITLVYRFGTNGISLRSLGVPEPGSEMRIEGDGFTLEAGTNLTPIPAAGVEGGTGERRMTTAASAPEIPLDGTEGLVMIHASWQEGDGEITLVAPDGERITAVAEGVRMEGMEAVKLDKQAYFFLTSPEAGVYRVEVDDAAVIGLQAAGYVVNAAPELAFAEMAYNGVEQQVELAWTVQDPDDTAEVTLYYDTDASGGDGVPIEGVFPSDGEKSHEWDVSDLPHGTYWIYAQIDDGRNMPVTVYADQPFTHIQAGAPESPSGLSAVSRNGGIDLAWDAVPGIEAYLVTLLDSGTGEAAGSLSVEGARTAYVSSAAVAPGTYRVQVQAETAEGVQSVPAEAEVTVTAAAPPVLEPVWSDADGVTSEASITLQLPLQEDVSAVVLHQGAVVRTGLSGDVTETLALEPGMNAFHIRAVDQKGDEAEAFYQVFYDDLAPMLDLEPIGYETAGGESFARIRGWTSSLNEVTVDQIGVPLDAEGNFDVLLPVAAGKVTFVVKVRSPSGLETVRSLSLKERLVEIPDTKLEEALRTLLNKPEEAGALKVADLELLTKADLSDKGIRDLTGLEYASNLTELTLEGNTLDAASLYRIAGLSQLQLLDVERTGITDLSPFAGMDFLSALLVSGNPVESFEPLTEMRLVSLVASDIPLDNDDLAVIGSLPEMSYLELNNTGITGLEPLAGLTELSHLSLNDNEIEDIRILSGLPLLDSLHLSNNNISDIDVLSELTQLSFALNLSGNPLEGAGPIGALTKLTQLNLNSTGISDISMLGGLTELQVLHVAGNQIASIDALDGFDKLISLLASDNKIERIGVMLEWSSLTGAEIDRNPLKPAAEAVIRQLQAKGVSLWYDEVFVLRGRVTQLDADGNEVVLAGAELHIEKDDHLYGTVVKTDENGYFLQHVSSGTYNITRVTHEEQVMSTEVRGPFTLLEEQEAVIDILLPADNVAGRIKQQGNDWSGGAGQAVVHKSGGGTLYPLNIEADGSFSALFEAGEYEIREIYTYNAEGEKQLFAIANIPFTVAGDGYPMTMNFSVIPINIYGKVVEEGTDRPLGPGFLTISPVSGNSTIEVKSDGTFGHSLPAGVYTIRQVYLIGVKDGKDLQGYLNHSFEVTDESTALPLELAIPMNHVLKGSFRFEDERPISYASVRLRILDEFYREYGSYIKEDGTYEVMLPEGTYRIVEAVETGNGGSTSYPLSEEAFAITGEMTEPSVRNITVRLGEENPPPELELSLVFPNDVWLTHESTPRVILRATEGADIRVFHEGLEVGSGTGAGAANVTVPVGPLQDGTYLLTVAAKDASGSEEELAIPAVTVDTQPPALELVSAPEVTDDTTPVLVLRAEVGAYIDVLDDFWLLGTGVGAGATDVAITLSSLAVGPHTLHITARDEAGNRSYLPVTIEIQAPSAGPSAPVVVSPAAPVLTNADSVDIVIAALAAGHTAKVYEGTVEVGSAQGVSGGGAGPVTVTIHNPTEGIHEYTVRIVDADGNMSMAVLVPAVTIDRTPPAAPSLIGTVGPVTNGTPSITLQSEPGATVTAAVYTQGSQTSLLTVVLDESAEAALHLAGTAGELPPGVYEVTLHATDRAGNAGDDVTRFMFTVDTNLPALTVVSPVREWLTNHAAPEIMIAAEAGAAIRVLDGTKIVAEAAGRGGEAIAIPLAGLAEGVHMLKVQAADEAGNVSEALLPAIRVDRTAPLAPVLIEPAEAVESTSDSIKVVVKAEQGAVLRIWDGTEILATGTGKGSASVEITLSSLNIGVYTGLKVTAEDAAGNISGAAVLPEIRIKEETPASPGPGGETPGGGTPGGGLPGGGFPGGGLPGSGLQPPPVTEPSVNPIPGGVAIQAPAALEIDGEREVASAALDGDLLQRAVDTLEAASPDQTITVEIEGDHRAAKLHIPADAMQAAVKDRPDAVLSVKSGGVTYDLPLAALDLEGMAAAAGLPLKDLKVTVMIEEVTGSESERIAASARDSGVSLIGGILSFTVAIEAADGQSREVESFGGTYVARSIPLNETIADPSRVTGVLYDSETGELRFVPAVFTTVDGVTTGTLKRNGNSIYTVIRSDRTFSDIGDHWAMEEIELLASKLILSGISDAAFAPDAAITRAEFAALLVRALGLEPEETPSTFTDVAASDWFAGVVGAAVKAGLIEGYEDGTFRPHDQITREQLAVMIARAVRAAGTIVDANGKQELLTQFEDRASISSWAELAVLQALEAGIIQGMTEEAFAPAANATRAQAAVMLKRMLQVVHFIN